MPDEIKETAPKTKSSVAVLEKPAPAPEPEAKTEDPDSYVIWVFKPTAERNAPFSIQFPPDERSRDILADLSVPKGMSSLPLTSEWINFGPNQLPLKTVRAIQSHPASAAHVEHLVKEGVLQIMTPDRADIEGISNDTAMSIHFTEQKAIALINASYDKAELELWNSRESSARPNVARAIAARLKALKDDEDESLRSAERAHVDTV
jgi:hypothetical protein